MEMRERWNIKEKETRSVDLNKGKMEYKREKVRDEVQKKEEREREIEYKREKKIR